MKRLLLGVLATCLALLAVSPVKAITITAPATAEVDRQLNIGVSITTSGGASTCPVEIDYGEGKGWSYIGDCVNQTCNYTLPHTYVKSGSYLVQARTSTCTATVVPPDPASRLITVLDLQLHRLQLFFENQQPKITVAQNHKGLQAAVTISYSGSGLLEGYWEVDGRPINRVSRQLAASEQSVTLTTPVAPALPTYAAGSHRLRFVVSRPQLAIGFPEAIYFVTSDEAVRLGVIELSGPSDRATIRCEPTIFQWRTTANSYAYLVEFLDPDEERLVFSAYVKKGQYTLRGDVCRAVFTPEGFYRWRVKGFNEAGEPTASSPVQSIFLTATPAR